MTRFALRLLGILSFVPLTAGCDRDANASPPAVHRPYIGPERAPVETKTEELERRACEAKMRETLALPAVPGAPGFESKRATLLARTKAEPVFFTETPGYGNEEVPMSVTGHRKMFEAGWNGYGVVSRILEESDGFPRNARQVLLKNGYLYADDPDFAYSLVTLVQPHQLFGHDRIWIQRGESVVHAEKRNGRYYYVDGPLEGKKVRLSLFDRAGGGDVPDPPIHLDFRALRYRLHFDRIQVRHVTTTQVVANLRYGKWWVPSVFKTEGAHVELECETLAPHLRAEVDEWRTAGARREHAVQQLRHAMLNELDEAVPFDEPLHEYGFQLDGTLRQKWTTAYGWQRNSYALNGDAYPVFDAKGRPLPPQVCVDFLTDTFERTAGTWWQPRGEKPGRIVGRLDFDTLVKNRQELRRVPAFVEFAKTRPEWFDVKEDAAHVELGKKADFVAYITEHADDFAPGDAVLIKGKTPWDPGHVHFHSFFVYESDPVTGIPMVVVGNAGRPSLRSWETEIRRTPKRSIHFRIRPKTEWLESIAAIEPLGFVPPLAAGPE